MSEFYFSSPWSYIFPNFDSNLLEFYIFDLIPSSELLDDELRIRPELYLCRTEFDGTSDAEKCGTIFGDIIGRMTDILMTFLDRDSLLIDDKNPTPWRSRISSRSSVCIYDKVHKKINRNTDRRHIGSDLSRKTSVVFVYVYVSFFYTSSSSRRNWGVR